MASKSRASALRVNVTYNDNVFRHTCFQLHFYYMLPIAPSCTLHHIMDRTYRIHIPCFSFKFGVHDAIHARRAERTVPYRYYEHTCFRLHLDITCGQWLPLALSIVDVYTFPAPKFAPKPSCDVRMRDATQAHSTGTFCAPVSAPPPASSPSRCRTDGTSHA